MCVCVQAPVGSDGRAYFCAGFFTALSQLILRLAGFDSRQQFHSKHQELGTLERNFASDIYNFIRWDEAGGGAIEVF